MPLAVSVVAGVFSFFVTRALAGDELERTEIRIFRPYADAATYEPTISPKLTVGKRLRGECFINVSLADLAVEEAHRCFAENYVLDPCWDVGDGLRRDRVVCVATPWDTEAVVVNVRRWTFLEGPTARVWKPERDGPPPRRPAIERTPPWAVELEEDERCYFLTGTSVVLAGKRANYGCDPDEKFVFDAYLVGVPNRKTEPWTIRFIRPGANAVAEKRIAVAWY